MKEQTIGHRVKEARLAKDWSVAKLAREAELTETSVYRIEAGERQRPRADSLAALARALGISSDRLLGIDGESALDGAHPLGQTTDLPVVTQIAAGGDPPSAVEEWVAMPEVCLPEGVARESLFVLRVTDDLMSPEVCEGDLVIAALGVDLDDGDLAVVTGDHPRIRRIYLQRKRVCAVTNRLGEPVEYLAHELVVARVMKIIRDI